MANDLRALTGVYANGLGSISPGQASTNRNYTAVALVDAGSLPVIGSGNLYTLLNTTAIAPLASNIHLIIADLALRNKARLFMSKTINGTKEKTTELKTGVIYGNLSQETPTGEITDLWHFTFKNFYQNIEGMNAIRFNSESYDIALFTNNTIETIYNSRDYPQVINIGDEVDGNNSQARNGMFDVGIRGANGSIVPTFGVNSAYLTQENVNFVISAGTLVNLVAGSCSGKFKRYTQSSGATLSSIAFSAAPVVTCVEWSVTVLDANGFPQPVTTANQASINTSSGLLTFPSTHAVGTFKYIVTVQNQAGIFGQFFVEFVAI